MAVASARGHKQPTYGFVELEELDIELSNAIISDAIRIHSFQAGRRTALMLRCCQVCGELKSPKQKLTSK
jgi:hypothetical protein